MRNIPVRIREFMPWFVAAVAVLSGNMAATVLYESVNNYRSGFWSFSYFYSAYVLIFVLSVVGLYHLRGQFMRPRTRIIGRNKTEERSHIVFFVSKLSDTIVKSQGIPAGVEISSDLPADIRKITELKLANNMPFWPWEMILRGLNQHWNTIAGATFICSEDSIKQVHLIVNICSKYKFPRLPRFYLLVKDTIAGYDLVPLSAPCSEVQFKGIDFEDFDELAVALEVMIHRLREESYTEKDIMIDITGGQKPTSAVAASVTFNRSIKAQYVRTNKFWEVISYDVVMPSSSTEGFGI